jgi:hypothetical protein
MAGTKRRKLSPRLINQPMPPWAQRLVNEGVAPREGEDGCDGWFGWLYCGDAVPGLPMGGQSRGATAVVRCPETAEQTMKLKVEVRGLEELKAALARLSYARWRSRWAPRFDCSRW